MEGVLTHKGRKGQDKCKLIIISYVYNHFNFCHYYRQTERQTDNRQTDRQTDKQTTGKQTDRPQTDRYTGYTQLGKTQLQSNELL